MELKFFTDLIDALGKVAAGLKAIVNLPKAEREAMRKTLDETYRLIDTTLNVVIIQQSAAGARSANLDAQKTRASRDALAAFRTALVDERQELIKQELELYTLV